ncbi:ribosomal protein S18 acetylase RimI-like enzyme [Bradyrhizobium sp. LM6.10]
MSHALAVSGVSRTVGQSFWRCEISGSNVRACLVGQMAFDCFGSPVSRRSDARICCEEFETTSRSHEQRWRKNLSDIVIRPATEVDAAEIAAIHVASWRDTYASIFSPEFLSGQIEADRLAIWSQRLCDRRSDQLVNVAMCTTGRIQGFICGYCDFDPVWGSLVANLHVLPEARGQSIGERLFRSVVREVAERQSKLGLYLWVYEANEAALRFYKRLGGRVAGTRNSDGNIVLLVHWAMLPGVLE